MGMTKVLKLSLLGRLQLYQDGEPLAGLVSSKAQALLCYLAVTGRPHSRQALAGLLWGDLPEPDARRNLRGALLKLRQHVASYLLVTHQTLAFNRESNYWLDVEAFRARLDYRSGKGVTPASLREGVVLYRGDFLEDFHVRQAPAFDDWVMQQRAQLQELALTAYQTLAIDCTERGEYGQGIDYARRLLRIEPAREETQRQLMLLLALSGQRSAALAQFETCRRLLNDELGVGPSTETTTLVERIRSGEVRQESGERQASRRVVATVTNGSWPVTKATELPAEELPPFIVGPPLIHPRQFFGRERQVKRLFHLLKRLPLQNAAVIGPRRSGKTSLLHYLKSVTVTDPDQLRPSQRRDWLPQPERYRWIFVDFQDPRLGDSSGLLRYLLSGLGLPVPDTCDLDYFLDVVSDNLRHPTVILFDEIGVALERYPELDDAFWESLRSLATNQVGGRLAFILSGPEPPEKLAQYSGLGSPFFNIFGYTATLGPLSESESHELIASSPMPFPEADVEWILAESGRWPILLQILCRERLLSLEDGLSGPDWRDDARRQAAPFREALPGEA
jgi:DNA-binding SARP family transcriptional activator